MILNKGLALKNTLLDDELTRPKMSNAFTLLNPVARLMTDFKTLKFTVENTVATLTLNRPESANGLNMEMGRELMLAAIECDENPEIRCVIITGEGKMFSAGGDLKSFVDYGDRLPMAIKELTGYLHAAISRFARMEAPVIVAVNGMAAGAGMSMAVSGDFVIAAQSAKFTMAYTAAGLSPDGSASFYLPRLIGLRRTQELMITNRRLSAEEAYDWGLLTKVVENENLMEEAEKLAQQIAQGPTKAFGQVKKLMLSTFDQSLETQMELEAQGIAHMTNCHDGKEGIQAFLEKRAPEFTGK
jgi:2-(1,2-epoxy-1,2-dihydrophenyl)acetyl-CoA isomerase